MFSDVKTPFQHWRHDCAEDDAEAGRPVDYKQIGHDWKHSAAADAGREALTLRWLRNIKRFAEDVMVDLPETLEDGYVRTYRRDSDILTKAYTIETVYGTQQQVTPSPFHGGKWFSLVRAPENALVTITREGPGIIGHLEDGRVVLRDEYDRHWCIVSHGFTPIGTCHSTFSSRVTGDFGRVYLK